VEDVVAGWLPLTFAPCWRWVEDILV
jgi:hypothetical protein